MLGIVVTLIVGLAVGAVARLFLGNKDPGGMVMTMLIGVSGALLGLFVGTAAGWFDSPTDSNAIVSSLVGAMLLLVGYRVVVGGAHPVKTI